MLFCVYKKEWFTASSWKLVLEPVNHSTDKMGATFLVAMVFASVLSASFSSPNSQCSHVGANVWVAVRSQTHIDLSCLWKDNTGSLVAFSDVDVPIRWYNNTVEIMNGTGVAGDGIDFTIQSFRNVRNAHLTISLPDDQSRIRAEGNYSCGCAGFNERGAQVLIGEWIMQDFACQ